jgi:hypothetical protein
MIGSTLFISDIPIRCIDTKATGLNGKFLRFRRDDVSKPRSFYKAGIEKLVTRWETVIASSGNYITD